MEVNATPEISVSYLGPDATGDGTLVVEYDFPNTAASSQRDLTVYLDGKAWPNYVATTEPAQRTGTWNLPLDVTCWTTGNHTVRVAAQACPSVSSDPSLKANESLTLTVDSTPDISAQFIGPHDAGQGSLSIDYTFPNTTSANDRSIAVYLDGTGYPNYYAAQLSSPMSANWTIPVNTACWTQGPHSFRVTARSCHNSEDPSFVTTEFAEFQVDHAPVLAIEVLGTDATTADLRIDYKFPETVSASQRSLKLDWLPSKTAAGQSISTLNAPAAEGQWLITVSRQPHDEIVRITAVSCSNVTTLDYATIPKADEKCCSQSQSPGFCFLDPIRAASGNMRYTERDPLPGEFTSELSRTYDSGTAGAGFFGMGWYSAFDAWLRATPADIVIGTEDNARVVFRVLASGFTQVWPTNGTSVGSLTQEPDGTYVYREAGSDLTRRFRSSDGRLTAFRRLTTGSEVQITYDAAGAPQHVADADERWAWTLAVSSGRVAAIAVDGRPDLEWTYQYDGSGHLTSVLAPDDIAWRTYQYDAGLLAEIRDAGGNLIESHDYDASGRALTSSGPSGEGSNIQYDEPGRVPEEAVTVVTMASGKVSRYYMRPIGGRPMTVQVEGGCSSCGADDAVYGYDEQGRLVREQGPRGYLTVRSYDATGTSLTEVSGPWKPAGCDPATDAAQCRLTPDTIGTVTLASTPQTAITLYTYSDLNWPAKPTIVTTDSVRNPGQARTETSTYDPATGVILTRSVTGWTDDPVRQETRITTTTLYDGVAVAAFDPCNGTTCGFAASWLTLAQPVSLRKRVDGP